jgi:ribonucleoside-diphosphate reductase alpha chain
MKIERRFTRAGADAYAEVDFTTTSSEIRNPNGTIVFRLDEVEVPAGWSQVASDVIAQKYFRKAGVPAALKPVKERGVPDFLWRHVADEKALEEMPEDQRYGGETSAKQVFRRLAGAWAYWGWKGGYFSSEEDARAYLDEMQLMLARQMAAPNSPQWFNTGLHWAYGIDGPSQGHHYVDYKTGKLTKSSSAYEHPQPHACFIQSVADDLVNDGGIMDLWVREARLFKYGSGTGTNFSFLRGEGEKLSGGGKSSGLMGFLKIGDRAAGAIKSGGTTRRAAKMVIVDADHPDIEEFIDWKVVEEQKVASLVAGSKMHERTLNGIFEAIQSWDGSIEDAVDPAKNDTLKKPRSAPRKKASVPETYIKRVLDYARQGYTEHRVPDLRHRLGQRGLFERLRPELQQLHPRDRRLPEGGRGRRGLGADQPQGRHDRQDREGARSVGEGRPCRLGLRRSGHPVPRHRERVAHLPRGWRDPRLEPVLGVHVPRRHGLQPGVDEPADLLHRRQFDAESYMHATRLWTLTLEISVMMAQFPSKEIAQLSYDFRTLGLGYANIGGLLMNMGLGYDSAEGRAICGALTAIMTGVAYATSAEIASELGPFSGFEAEPGAHAARDAQPPRRGLWQDRGLRGGEREPRGARPRQLPRQAAGGAGQAVLGRGADAGRGPWLPQRAGHRHRAHRHDRPGDGLRHDRDRARLRAGEVQEARRWRLLQDHQPLGAGRARDAGLHLLPDRGDHRLRGRSRHAGAGAGMNHTSLIGHGFGPAEIEKIEAALPSAFDIRFVFNQWTLGEEFCTKTLGIPAEKLNDPTFDMLRTSASPRPRSTRPTTMSAGR